MQDDLFGDPATATQPAKKPDLQHPAAHHAAGARAHTADTPSARPRRSAGGIAPAAWSEALHALGAQLPARLRLGTSSWGYPGWQGLVWAGAHSEQALSRNGLPVLAQHPLLRTVSIDRGFYRPLTVSDYARYAGQVPEDFRFVVKAPSVVTDALVRSEDGRGREANPAFLDPTLAVQSFVAPALEGLGPKVGALVFQLSPLPWQQLDRLDAVIERLHTLLQALPPLAPHAPDGVVALEVRDPEWLSPDYLPRLVEVLQAGRATWCLGLHPKMPPLQDQLPLLRRLWPGPLVCRWNLHPANGPYGYEAAEKRYAPYDRIHDPDPALIDALAQLVHAFTQRGQNAYVTISNHAEGCAPLSAERLAQKVSSLPKM
ncbi:DUF72 domain-containing protein [Acidovorax lacteus]|uniref:DUF72 domain-containing protein n=1 Tax=Acidovorax lacteus TaxID=1924988 RepID=A0ABP8L4X6_9BURK